MKKLIRRILFLLLCIFCSAVLLAAAVNLYVCQTVSSRILTEEEFADMPEADLILVLGCSVRADGEASPMLRDRVQEGVALYELGFSDTILMSGDHRTDDYNETDVMKELAEKAGVPKDDILMDPAGLSTYESVIRAKEVYGAKRIVIVTQKYHLYRAVYIAKQLGLDAWGVACEGGSYPGQTVREFREIAARAKDFLVCLAG